MSDFINNLPPSLREALTQQQANETPDYLREKIARMMGAEAPVAEDEFTKARQAKDVRPINQKANFKTGDRVIPKDASGCIINREYKIVNVTELGYILDDGRGIELADEDEWILVHRPLETKISTDINQSKRLMELGLDPRTADMFWETVGRSDILGVGKHVAITNDLFSFRKGLVVPAWSLSALLDIMPQHIDQNIGWQKFGLDKGWDGGMYQVYYENQNSYIEKKAKTAIDAAYEMVCWLLEKGFIKKED